MQVEVDDGEVEKLKDKFIQLTCRVKIWYNKERCGELGEMLAVTNYRFTRVRGR